MTIGELLRKYRLTQAKTKKEWAGTALSPSFYARVERGLNRISAEDLIRLLHANKISVIKFFEQLDPHDYRISKEEQALYLAINKAYYSGAKADLLKLYDKIVHSDLLNNEDHLMLIDIYLAIIDDDYTSINTATLEKLKERIFVVDNFDTETLNLYCKCIVFYSLDDNLVIAKRVLEQVKDNDSISSQKYVLGIVINMLIFCIKEKRYQEAKFFANRAQAFATTPEIYFYKNLLLFFTSLLNYREKSEKNIWTNAATLFAMLTSQV
ncbi:helix-turn-helix domain-containing protein [Lactobacillus xylocopicola]|uniref:HTH-type transcriptional regulator Rgg C-terminal domain-containing protein n=1 Tax=Lactobacillus xylocopicola TaxID=2976676 RepID=A0ABM8BI00_9LACO|nr:Rgg/GadR/MutR family transcriptional regulator [Lactobacillus xylocopicola]BDR60925.1 hypothetical protein KIM322_11860 [Lactobacillus xylocopicola]